MSGPLQGPYRHERLSPGPTDLRPVRPGVSTIQGRWPCAGLRPALTLRQLAACLIADEKKVAVGSLSAANPRQESSTVVKNMKNYYYFFISTIRDKGLADNLGGRSRAVAEASHDDVQTIKRLVTLHTLSIDIGLADDNLAGIPEFVDTGHDI